MAKIEHVDLGLRVYDALKDMILSGKLAPGQRITQIKLAEEIGVSRTPLLKALQMLEHELLVVSIPRRGMFVKAMKREEIIDAFDCREGLEGIAARLTAERITSTQLRRLEKLFAPYRNQSDIPIKEYGRVDQQFHKLLIQFSGNQILPRVEMVGNIHLISYNRGLIRPPKETLPEHFAIIDAIARHDSDQAEQQARAHLRKSRDLLAASLADEVDEI
ncbi:MAG: GntR family transcriptional regulator [Phycisphaeraceae bacterium]|nr:GntR family transcriptional regulator [Phycisphaeraceae bacterium]